MLVGISICIGSLATAAQSGWAAPAAQKVPGSLASDLKTFVRTVDIPGYENNFAAEIRSRLRAYSPTTDNLGDVIVTLGQGSPRRLIVAPMDEPGYVVSHITPDGYLQLQRLPQFTLIPLFNELYAAQPVRIETASGRWIPGVVAGISIHLLPGRVHPPNPNNIRNMYVDVGASTAAEARQAGADLLSPVALDRKLYELGGQEWAGDAVGDRFGDAALVDVLRHLAPAKLHGETIVAFVAQQWTGARGLERVLTRYKPDELIYVGRLLSSGSRFGPPPRFPGKLPGSGVLEGVANPDEPVSSLGAEIEAIARKNSIPVAEDYSAPLMPKSYLPTPPLPKRYVHLAIATAWPSTPAEVISGHDLSDLVMLLEDYLQGSAVKPALPSAEALAEPPLPARPASAPSPEQLVRILTEAYGVSGHEAAVRETVERLLPPWAKPSTDKAGNLILHVASAPATAHIRRIVVDAHMDEIGFQVQSILPDGRLEVEWRGGALPYFYLGHVCFVHTRNGIRPGVMELPKGWQQPGFKWSLERDLHRNDYVDVGAKSAAEVANLGIHVGDFITIPKKYRHLAGTRATVRSFDDRVGDAALISAVWALGPNLKNRNITFMWSTGEELGLVGAGKAARRWAAEGKTPAYIFAVDTFVSSDSPLESTRFADAPLGKGFVVRAVDNSNIVPRNYVEKVLRLARDNHIPAQYGVTGGGNNGSAFLRYGTVDVALGWPLRYSHSPAEEIDTRDLDALAHIVTAISRDW